ncbi:sugar phosphate isomerase/epimerase [Lentisphaera profundi]|uniref:Sugar phosphate isomerase/epimerase n=1 Tax=Lentisphaera profundi TaxID=1658616 RepID=A0ABY7VTV8_9BACT|nr:sugar phosphate isomerase/epimerase family protein [Lentisphaera profundi]WDE97638.1 sugar phosphate isomerase/epimerase [Lentisphaera profundi]
MKKSLLVFLCTLLSFSLFSEDKLQIKFALKYGMIKTKASVLDKFKLVKELGYDGIEVNGPSNNREAFKAASEASGLPIHGVVCSTHWKLQLSDPDESIRAKGLEGFKQAIRDAKFYGASSVLLVPAKVRKGVTFEECWERSIIEIKKALPLAKELGINILLENVWNDFLTTPEDTLKYINELNSDLVGSYFDIGNTVRYNPPASWPPVLGNKIMKLDVKPYVKQPKGQNLYKGFQAKIGQDDNDWPAVCKALKAINYSGWATAEVGGGDKERLAEILANMQKVFSH